MALADSHAWSRSTTDSSPLNNLQSAMHCSKLSAKQSLRPCTKPRPCVKPRSNSCRKRSPSDRSGMSALPAAIFIKRRSACPTFKNIVSIASSLPSSHKSRSTASASQPSHVKDQSQFSTSSAFTSTILSMAARIASPTWTPATTPNISAISSKEACGIGERKKTGPTDTANRPQRNAIETALKWQI